MARYWDPDIEGWAEWHCEEGQVEEQDHEANRKALQEGLRDDWHDGRCEKCGEVLDENNLVWADHDRERFYCTHDCYQEGEAGYYNGTISDYDERMAERRQMGLCDF